MAVDRSCLLDVPRRLIAIDSVNPSLAPGEFVEVESVARCAEALVPAARAFCGGP